MAIRQLRHKVTVALSAPYVLRFVPRANHWLRHPEAHSDAECYALARQVMDHMRRLSRTETIVTGLDNLPDEGGYLLFANHQGKYDALGILLNHPTPCSVLWEQAAADRFSARQMNGLLRGKTINLQQPRAALQVIRAITDEVVAGRRYLIFPEGGYAANGNTLQPFKSGCCLCALRSGVPIVPVALYDSYRAMDTNTFERVITQVHYLTPIREEEYRDLTRGQLAELVKSRIQAKMETLSSLCPLQS